VKANPKSEIRNPKENRSSKSEIEASRFGLVVELTGCGSTSARRRGPSPSAKRMNVNSRGCQPTETCLYRINGVEDHFHIFTSLHPTVCLSDLVKDIKVSTSKWMKEDGGFPAFTHWQDGYGAFTVSQSDKGAVIEYIKSQQEHHKKVSFRDELRALLVKYGVEFDERYLG
jgi:hypothetical protein